jgi:thiol-disulfide isomerase/thioredoxin
MNQKLVKNLIIFVVLIIFILSGVLIFSQKSKKEERAKEKFEKPEKVAEKVLDYINQQIPFSKASLIEAIEENGVYKIKFEIGKEKMEVFATKDGKFLFLQAIDLEKFFSQREKMTIGDFLVSEDKICKENEKPIIYFFGSKGCPHCRWEHPILEKVAEKFKDYISFHNNMDSDKDREIFEKYSTGGIPTLVFGCKYYRVGSGERVGEEKETKNLTALICKLTENQPKEICDEVKELIEKIKE